MERFALAAGDPADAEALRAAEIVLGAPFEIVTASFEDIATVLGDKLDADEAAARRPRSARSEPPTRASTICATSPAARRSCARSMTSSKRRSSCARAIFISSPFATGSPCACASTVYCERSPRRLTCRRRRVVSRVKILAGLNIAERRLPQDGAARLRAARADIDIRVATMPTQHGESAVLRLLAARPRSARHSANSACPRATKERCDAFSICRTA